MRSRKPGVQADQAVEAAVRVGLGADEITAEVPAHEFPVPVDRDVAEGGDLPLVQFLDRAAEPIALHPREGVPTRVS